MKVFVAGEPWGVVLAKKDIATRKGLADKLGEVYKSKQGGLGNGNALDIIVLNSQGRAKRQLMPSGSGSKEASDLRAVLSGAVKVYVKV